MVREGETVLKFPSGLRRPAESWMRLGVALGYRLVLVRALLGRALRSRRRRLQAPARTARACAPVCRSRRTRPAPRCLMNPRSRRTRPRPSSCTWCGVAGARSSRRPCARCSNRAIRKPGFTSWWPREAEELVTPRWRRRPRRSSAASATATALQRTRSCRLDAGRGVEADQLNWALRPQVLKPRSTSGSVRLDRPERRLLRSPIRTSTPPHRRRSPATASPIRA